MDAQDDPDGTRHARQTGAVCGFLHGFAAIPVLAIALFVAAPSSYDYTLLVVRAPDAPEGAVRAWIDGHELSPRLSGAAGVEFRAERRHRPETTLVLALDGDPAFRAERRLRVRDESCPVVVRMERAGFVAGPCLWRPAYMN